MKFILIMMIAFCSINSWTISFETESGRKYKEFSEGEFINKDKWFDLSFNDPRFDDARIYELGGVASLGIITMCLYGHVYVRQINHGEFTVIYNKGGTPLACKRLIDARKKN
mgnify:CR=1 FL=1